MSAEERELTDRALMRERESVERGSMEEVS